MLRQHKSMTSFSGSDCKGLGTSEKIQFQITAKTNAVGSHMKLLQLIYCRIAIWFRNTNYFSNITLSNKTIFKNAARQIKLLQIRRIVSHNGMCPCQHCHGQILMQKHVPYLSRQTCQLIRLYYKLS